MKLNKKIFCAALAAAMSLSSVAALAAVPVPKDHVQAFIYAEKYFDEGLYYEAKEELNHIANNTCYYDNTYYEYEANKLSVWQKKVDERIIDWEITEIFNAVEAAYDANDVLKARAELAALQTGGKYEFYLNYWENEAVKAWADVLSKIATEDQAIVIVEKAIGKLWDPTLYYSVVAANGGWDVYIKSCDTYHNVACYHVDGKTGAWYEDVIDWNGNPASSFEYRNNAPDAL